MPKIPNSAKSNPAAKRMQNVKLKNKRINNKARNQRVSLASGFSSVTALRNWCRAHKRDVDPFARAIAHKLAQAWR